MRLPIHWLSLVSSMASANVFLDRDSPQGWIRQDIPMQLPDGETMTYTKFTRIMQGLDDPNQRDLQNFDAGNCVSDGQHFTCTPVSEYSAGPNTTGISTNITCNLDPAIGMNYQDPSLDCQCTATLNQVNRTDRLCACQPCSAQSPQALAMDCTNNEAPEDKYVLSTCVSINCNGQCNNTGPSFFGPMPSTGASEAPAAAPGTSGGARMVSAVGVLGAAVLAMVL